MAGSDSPLVKGQLECVAGRLEVARPVFDDRDQVGVHSCVRNEP